MTFIKQRTFLCTDRKNQYNILLNNNALCVTRLGKLEWEDKHITYKVSLILLGNFQAFGNIAIKN